LLIQRPTSCRKPRRDAIATGWASHAIDTLPADLGREYRAEAVPPQPHSLVTNVDAAFGEEVLHAAQRQRLLIVYDRDDADHVW
jgi:hypothetical protein